MEKTYRVKEFYFKQGEEPPILVKLSSAKTVQEIEKLNLGFLLKNTKSVQENENAKERYLLKMILQLKKNIKELTERVNELEKEKK